MPPRGCFPRNVQGYVGNNRVVLTITFCIDRVYCIIHAKASFSSAYMLSVYTFRVRYGEGGGGGSAMRNVSEISRIEHGRRCHCMKLNVIEHEERQKLHFVINKLLVADRS